MTAGELAARIGAEAETIRFAEGLPPPSEEERAAFYANPDAFIAAAKNRPDFNEYMLGFYLRLAAAEGRRRFSAAGFGEEVFIDTVRDLALWSEIYRYETGKIGLADSEIQWMIPHMSAGIATLGRLQFKPNRMTGNLTAWDGTVYPDGTPLVEVHIPRGGSLTEACVEASFAAAAEAYGSPMLYRCESWLLSPVLSELLPPDSNILRFAARFWLQGTEPDNRSGLQYIRFSAAKNGPSRLSEGAERLLKEGRQIGAAIGWLVR